MKNIHILFGFFVVGLVFFILGLFYGHVFFSIIYDNSISVAYHDQGYVCYSGASLFAMDYVISHEECHYLVYSNFSHFCS